MPASPDGEKVSAAAARVRARSRPVKPTRAPSVRSLRMVRLLRCFGYVDIGPGPRLRKRSSYSSHVAVRIIEA
jgi:hypothetical protein